VEKLVQGVHKFQSKVFRKNLEFFNRLSKGQTPHALFITCSDSRVVPDLITQSDPGDLFVLRNAGNILPPYGTGSGAEASAIEYAVKGLGVKSVVVCGHTRCGAMKGLLDPDELAGLPEVRAWLRHAAAGKEIVDTLYRDLTGAARWKVMVEENVLSQMENLRTHPAVAAGLAMGTLTLHAWVYKMETGQVYAYDPDSGQYEPLAMPDGTAHVAPVRRTTTLREPDAAMT
jgi:carbonic anhydrase